jgi:hypothetical protein
MSGKRMADADRGEIFVTTNDDFLVVTQERYLTRTKRVTLSFTLDEARDVVTQLRRRIRLQEELERTGLA